MPLKIDEKSRYLQSPLGLLKISGTGEFITSISFIDTGNAIDTCGSNPYLEHCAEQLAQYFSGTRMDFNLNLNPVGTDFQKQVWDILLKIPFGAARSYSWQSKEFGSILAVRAIAAANGQNKIPIIIPCHRIIGSNGEMTGYAGGIWRKKWLIEHERRIMGLDNQLVFEM